jgi:CHAT domain-containing protein
VIPDEALHLVPFAALRRSLGGEGGRYLFEDFVIGVAPSLRIFLETRRRDVNLRGASSIQELIVSDPAFDRTIDPDLRVLNAGAIEAKIATVFPGSELLRGREATREAFLELGRKFEILYFGGHSILNTRNPMLSSMLFAPEVGDPNRGALYASELLRRRLPKTRLVILASCKTGVGKLSSSEGVESLARPFLAIGVPSVIASLWSVNDRATADFFLRLHRHLEPGFDPVAALRATQLDYLKAGASYRRRTSVWAAFDVIGGGGWPKEGPNQGRHQAADPHPLRILP